MDFHLTHDSLGPSKPTTQTASRSFQPFLHRSPPSFPILYNGTPLSLEIAPSHSWETWTPSNTWFLGPTRVHDPNGISIGSAVFAGLTSVTDRPTDRPTDHATLSITIRHIYVRSIAMRRIKVLPAGKGKFVPCCRRTITKQPSCTTASAF